MTDKTKEALKLALEALEWHTQGKAYIPLKSQSALTAIREALADQCVCGEPDTPGTHRTDGPCLAEQPAQQERCHLCDCTGDIHSPDGEWRGECPYCKQPAQQQEPVAWMIWTHGPVLVFMNKDEANLEFDRLNHAYPAPTRMLVPLYTSPPAQRTWAGLTYEDAKEIYTCIHGYDSSKRIAEAIEAKLKEKNT